MRRIKLISYLIEKFMTSTAQTDPCASTAPNAESLSSNAKTLFSNAEFLSANAESLSANALLQQQPNALIHPLYASNIQKLVFSGP